MKARSYQINRTDDGVTATVNGEPLPLRLDLANHSPTGFEYGFGGSGPAQLALAILADHYQHAARPEPLRKAREALRGEGGGPGDLALRYHQSFKARVVAAIPQHTHDWVLSTGTIAKTLDSIYADMAARSRTQAASAKGGA